MTSKTPRIDMLTYRYPRTLREVENRYPCNAEEAKAIHGPYKAEWNPDNVVLYTSIGIVAALLVMTAIGWL